MTYRPVQILMLSCLLLTACTTVRSIEPPASAAALVVQRQVDAYNAHDIEALTAEGTKRCSRALLRRWPGRTRARSRADESLQPGRALARLSDLGWGQRLRDVLREDAPASPELLRACVPVLAEWRWAQRPVGVVAVPSRSHPALVTTLAAGLAQIGRLPLLGSLDLAHGGPVGEPGGNSAFRLAGVWERFVVGPELAAALAGVHGPVLLVDDLVSSRWTLTVAGRALRQAGASAVLPFALAVDG